MKELIERADLLTFLLVIVPQIACLFGALIMAEVDHNRDVAALKARGE